MALTESNMMKLGTKAPSFDLLDTVSGKNISLTDIQSDVATVVIFLCNHCPYVLHINSKLVEVANKYQAKGVQFVAISSNDITTHPQDAPELMTKLAIETKYPFPYLYDETQAVAKSYQAACTPDFYIFDKNLKCVYRGRFDDSRPIINTPTGKDLSNALDCLLDGGKISEVQHPSIGCNIKWK